MLDEGTDAFFRLNHVAPALGFGIMPFVVLEMVEGSERRHYINTVPFGDSEEVVQVPPMTFRHAADDAVFVDVHDSHLVITVAAAEVVRAVDPHTGGVDAVFAQRGEVRVPPSVIKVGPAEGVPIMPRGVDAVDPNTLRVIGFARHEVRTLHADALGVEVLRGKGRVASRRTRASGYNH